MQFACPHCDHVLEFSGERPKFCAFCGKSLSSIALEVTGAFDPEATVARSPEGSDGQITAVPAEVGGYRLIRPLGTGGMGTVYEAEDRCSGRRVALKLIAPEFATSTETVERFRQEGRLASGIAHPRCVFVLAADEEAGRPYIVMELMPGATLKDLVEREGPLPQEQAVAKILDVIDGLIEAHQLGVVHRDVKPSNCFLEADGRVKIGDFGLSKSLVNDAQLTRTGAFLGTPLFASPEQIRRERVDQQSDVYSVAATLYYLLTGRAPFETEDAAATMARIVSDPPPSMRTLRPELPRLLDKVVLRGLERERHRRWRNLEKMKSALLPFVPGHLSRGGMGLRVAAYLIDQLILSLPFPVVAVLWAANQTPAMECFVTAFGDFLGIGYFTVLEGIWGCSLGKRLLRLRVCPTQTLAPPGLARAFGRVLLYYVLVQMGFQVACLLQYFSAARDRSGTDLDASVAGLLIESLGWIWAVAGLGLVACTMRARNGYRGLHELLSGTCVLQLPWPEKRRTFRVRRTEDRLVVPEDLPESIGNFAILGAEPRHGADQIVLGEDRLLGRRVWIWLRPLGAPPLPSVRRTLTRITRLRWLGCGEYGDCRWDAFLAPAASPLRELMATEGSLPWSDVRPLLEQLTDELDKAGQDGTLPQPLRVDQIWIERTGRVILLDQPRQEVTGRLSSGENPHQEPLNLLRQVATLTLEGRLRKIDEEPPAPIQAPLPEHAMRMLDRLLGSTSPFETVAQVQAEFVETRDRPTEINRSLRAGQLALRAMLLIPFVLGSMAASFIVLGLGLMQATDLSLDEFEAAIGDEAYAQLLAEELKNRIITRGKSLDVPVYIVAGMIATMAAPAVFWVVWAFWCRGGLSYRMMGIAVARFRGGGASRLRCAWRALLAWLPLIVLPAAGLLWVHAMDPQGWDFLFLGWFLYWMVMGATLLIYLIVALLLPRRGPHDFLAGTYLVPK